MRMAALMTLFGIALGIGGCNTVSGLGQDVENTGDAVSDTAQSAEEQM